jgi:hypothetical protein
MLAALGGVADVERDPGLCVRIVEITDRIVASRTDGILAQSGPPG